MMKGSVRVSVITVTYNAAPVFPVTAKSIMEQDFPDFEWIVIDGASGDGTIQLIREYQNGISSWISEPDQGIYDAMNKGLHLAKGEWINFMNAGDSFADKNMLSGIFSGDQEDADILYGDSLVPYYGFTKVKKAGTPGNLLKGMVICHQSVFIRTEIVRKSGFDTGFPIGADYKLLLSLWKSGARFKYLGYAVAVFDNKGNTSISMYQTDLEHFRILKNEYRLNVSLWLYHQILLCWYAILTFLYTVFPGKMIFPFRDFVVKLLNPKSRLQ